MANNYVPPYTITDKTVNLISKITEIVTKITINDHMNKNPRLRRDNRIRTIQASLAIENNSLSLEQVTDIVNGKRILGAPDEICEVKNAFEAYEILLNLNPLSQKDLKKAHGILMKDLTKDPGIYRNGGVGIFAGQQLVHMAPPADMVPSLMTELFAWLKKSDAHPLIKSCVFHYEFEFIHPFMDGNGRMGRMWQTLLLYQWNTLFGWLPIETLIREQQQEYYNVLGICDHIADSGNFVEFLLSIIYDALIEIMETEQLTEQDTVQGTVQPSVQVIRLLECLNNKEYSTIELMQLLGLKHRPTFRNNYLLPALKAGLIEMTIPETPNSSKQKYRRTGK